MMSLRAHGATALLVAATLAGVSAAAADGAVTVRSGVPTIVLSFASLNPETCGHGPLPIMTIAQAPAHGTVSFQKYQHTVREGACAGTSVRSMGTVYRSNPGYRGSDSFSVDAATELWVNGIGMRANRSSFSIQVK